MKEKYPNTISSQEQPDGRRGEDVLIQPENHLRDVPSGSVTERIQSAPGKGKKWTDKLYPLTALGLILLIWELVSRMGIVPNFMLPSPVQMLKAMYTDASALAQNALTTLFEAIVGLLIGVAVGYLAAMIMDNWDGAYKALYPLIVVTQTIPTVAIAPLLVLWFGYDMKPKIILIILCTFFPVAVGVLDGFRSVDPDEVNLLRAMGATKAQIFRHIKFPGALPNFFSGLRISVAYAIVGAVLAEWLGGFRGLGVYMIRVKKSFAYDRMFAVILLISVISLILLWIVNLIQKKSMPWEQAVADGDESSR